MAEDVPPDIAPQINNPQQNKQLPLPGMEMHQVLMQSHSGPIPSPELLAGYEHAVPGSGDRIIKMAEQQATHRQQLEMHVLTARADDRKADRLERRIGQIFALLIGVIALAASSLVAIVVPNVGGATVASIIGGSTVIGLVTVFVIGNYQPKPGSDADTNKNTR